MAILRTFLAVSIAALLGGCTGGDRLAEAVVELNSEVADLQNRSILLNIVRRSMGHPMHFTALSIIRGRNRISGGANLTIPFGGGAADAYEFNPNVTIDQGPSFELSLQNNQEFYRGLLAPVSLDAIGFYLRQDRSRALVLSLMVDRIRIGTPEQLHLYVNDPEDERAITAFQATLQDLLDQGLTVEPIELLRNVGPPIGHGEIPDIAQLLSISQEGLVIEDMISSDNSRPANAPNAGSSRPFRLRQITQSMRFCFGAPTTRLFREAACRYVTGAQERRFMVDDPKLFSRVDLLPAAFDVGPVGRIEIHTRSVAEILDYLAQLIRVQQSSPERVPAVETDNGRKKIFVVDNSPRTDSAMLTVDYRGIRYAIPAGPEGGLSGDALSLVSQLLAQAQSVKDLPVSNAVTIVGD